MRKIWRVWFDAIIKHVKIFIHNRDIIHVINILIENNFPRQSFFRVYILEYFEHDFESLPKLD